MTPIGGGWHREGAVTQPGGMRVVCKRPSCFQVCQDKIHYPSRLSLCQVAVRWMVNNYSNRTNCILGDEMGLGKTAQVITRGVDDCAGDHRRGGEDSLRKGPPQGEVAYCRRQSLAVHIGGCRPSLGDPPPSPHPALSSPLRASPHSSACAVWAECAAPSCWWHPSPRWATGSGRSARGLTW